MTIKLRPYQEESIDNLRGLLRQKNKRLLLQASTGAGKTVIASRMIDLAIERGNHCLFVAHRKEIINQTSEKLDTFGIDHGVIMSGHRRHKPFLPVQVASIQTLSNRHKPKADLVIIDETHLACSKSFLALIEHYKDSVIIGLTATPIRLDGRGLGEIYSHIVEVVPMKQLITDGFLVRPRVFAPFTPDMAGVQTVRGDYDAAQVADLMDRSSITGDIVKHWQQHAARRKTIVFAASVAHSEHIRDAFLAAGISAKHLDGKTPAAVRDRTLSEWRAGRFEVLSNCGLFIEGLDVPEVSCCILARPTQSLTIYLQAVGRAMRPAANKTDCIILDHAGLTHRHGLIDEPREWSLAGKKRKSRKSENDEKAPSVAICEMCFAAFSRAEHPDECPDCGHELPKKERAAASVSGDGELVELTAEHLAAIKARKKQELKAAKTTEQLIELGRSRGYKNPAYWASKIQETRQQWRSSRG
jgi:DNA repair protein RadD